MKRTSRRRHVVSRRNVVSLIVSAVLLAHVGITSVFAQGTGLQRAASHPLNKPATDAEIVAALRGTDENVKELTVRRAALLLPNVLRPATVKAIGDELVKAIREGQVRFKKEPWNVNEGNSGFEYKASLAEVLTNQKNAAGIDGLASVAHMGAPGAALVEFGEAAVPALVKIAGTEPEEDDPGHVAAVMDTLEQMLESKSIRPTLSTGSLTAIRQVAAHRLASTKGNDNWGTLASAASLAVATGDDRLRKQVADLVDNDAEFARRGMDPEWQQEVSDLARQALAKFPE